VANRRRKIFIIAPVLVIGILLASEPVKDWLKAAYAARQPRTTPFPSSTQPDQVILTWSADPATTQTIQWRTSNGTGDEFVQYRKAGDPEEKNQQFKASFQIVKDKMLENDPSIQRNAAVLTGLAPDTRYTYRVGNNNAWSAWADFETAPAPSAPSPFSFLYLGDIQIGYDDWGNLLRQAVMKKPSLAFYVIPGDIVNRGNYRDEWDRLFNAARGTTERLPLISAIGNHECPQGSMPRFYLDLLALPENGPKDIRPERAYSLEYGNAFFVVLDTNLHPEDQRSWLEEQLANCKATWKFVVFHQPIYASVTRRDNHRVRDNWMDLLDKYHVDVVLQGHDHAYLRTFPMNAGKVVDSPDKGTIYTIAVSGSKFYEQKGPYDYAAVAFPDTPTYQIIDIETSPQDQLTYRAYDTQGTLRDEFKIQKARK
jgi:hypothetical protein